TADTFPSPAPAPPYGSSLSVFDGTPANGNWNLFVVDDLGGDSGQIAGGFCVDITTTGGGTPTGTPPTATATPCGGNPTWTTGPAYNPGVYAVQGGVSPANGNFYVAGGQDATNIPVPNVNRFNPATNTFTALAPLPVAVGQGAVGVTGTKMYVAGGYIGSNAITSTLQIYDIASNTWSFGPSMPSAVEAAAGVIYNNKFYVMGGDDFNVVVNTNYIYDIATNTWSTGAALPAGRSNLNGTVVGNYIYTAGGVIGAGFSADDALLRYDPAASSWTTLAPFGVAGYGNYAGISPYQTGKLFVLVGGDTSFDPISRTRIYDIATNSWTEGPAQLEPRMAHAQGTLQDGRIIVVSGYTGSGTYTTSNLLIPGTACITVTPTTPPATATATTPPATATATTPAGTATATSPAATNTPGAPTATPTACTLEFTDVPPTNTFYPFVRCLACQGIISGYPCGGDFEPCNANNDPYFRPNNPVTRGQIAKIVSLSAGFNEEVPPTQQSFEDVEYGSPFWEYIERLYTRGIVGGYQCGVDPNEPCVPPDNRPYFRPNNGATRGQLVKIDVESAGFGPVPNQEYTFADVPYGHTFWDVTERLLANRPNAISGYPCGQLPNEPCDSENRPYFRPNNGVTRGQASKIVANTFFPNCEAARP
ncbi:MAG TPA: kelch repeat-containing protein, partial [Chloroflexia bacterium]|nr:kelch repeat-containing protein [Chloroflexia bacterium]